MNANMHRRSISTLAAGMIVGALALSNLAAGDETTSAPVPGGVINGGTTPVSARILVATRPRIKAAEIPDAMALLDRIRGVVFDDPPVPHQFGFVASDVADVLPEAVQVDASGELSAVDHAAILPLAVQAIRELRAENAALRAENAALRADNAALHGEVSLLRARMERLELALQRLTMPDRD